MVLGYRGPLDLDGKGRERGDLMALRILQCLYDTDTQRWRL